MSPDPRHPELDVAALLEHVSLSELARRSGVVRRRLERRKQTGLTLDEADRCAVAVHLHPSVLWPAYTLIQFELCSLVCPQCQTRFVPARPQSHQRFCSRRCQRKQPWQRRKADERTLRYRRGKGAESNRLRRRAYYAENADYERARERARYRAKKAA